VLLLAAMGIALGYLLFFHVYPHKPKIGIIDIPFTIIIDRSADTISSQLEYARRDDSIKAVVIRLNSPGGAAAASEQLYFETRKLREEKPVVIAMGDLVASGGFMMAMGANYLFAEPSSLVGNVGVIISFPGPFLPPPPNENLVITGPSKMSGGDRRQWFMMADEMKRSFGGIVGMERGERLALSQDELLTGRIFSGIEAKNLGLIDELGGPTTAIEKAAALAGIFNYELVDVNSHVLRKSNEIRRWESDPILRDLHDLDRRPQASTTTGSEPQSLNAVSGEALGSDGLPKLGIDLELLRNILPQGAVGAGQAEALPGFPYKVSQPNVYYLYLGPSQ